MSYLAVRTPARKTLRRSVGDALVPAARAWVRYAPFAFGKRALWQTFHWRPRAFTCRTKYGGEMTGNTQDLIQRHLYFFGTWEPNISGYIASVLKPGDGFIDVGANIGHYSLLAARLVGAAGCVVAVEPAPWINVLLQQHVAMNRGRNIRIAPVAAAATRGTLQLFPGHAGNIGKASTVARTGKPVQVPALPLAEILHPDEIRRARLIKIDVEGGELDVVRGMAPLLPRLRDDAEIVMEITPSLLPGAERARDEIFAVMQRHGFGACVLDNDYGVETYLRRERKPPVKLADTKLTSQADILFSRTAH